MKRGVMTGLVALCACTKSPEAAPLRGSEFMCDEVITREDGPVCELMAGSDAEVRVWIPGERPEVWIDDVLAEPEAVQAVDDGWRLTLHPDEGASKVVVRRSGQPTEWRLPLVWRSYEAFDNTLGEAYVARRWGDCKALAVDEFAGARGAGRWLRALTVAMIAVECSIGDRDMPALGRWLAEVEQVPTGNDVRGLRRDQVLVATLEEHGVLYAIAEPLERALTRSLRLGATSIHAEMLMRRSRLMADIGDYDGAIAAANAALDPVAHPYIGHCDRVSFRVNLAWTLLRAASRTGESSRLDQAADELLVALALAEEYECRSSTAYLNLAWVELLDGAPQAAARWLDMVEPLIAADDDGWRDELHMLRARTAIATGDVTGARELIDRVGGGLSTELTADLVLIQAALAEAEGDLLRAEEILMGEHRRMLDQIGVVGHEQGMSRNMVDRLTATQGLVRVMLDRGDNGGAFAVAREAAASDARLLAARHAGARDAAVRGEYLGWRDACERLLVEHWDRPGPEREALCAEARREAALREGGVIGDGSTVDLRDLSLRVPAAGEVLLLYFPLTRERVLGFAATADAVFTAEIEAVAIPSGERGGLDTATLAAAGEALLGQFERVLDGARRVRVLPSFGRQSLPFHALPWRGQPLLMHTDVVTSLDLPARGESDGERSGVLVLGDPHGNLASAREEVEALAASWRGNGAAVHALVGKFEVTGPAVRALLPEVEHLHYAGHSEHGGEFGWTGALRLSEGTALSIPDILALDQVPRTVSLLSCASGVVEEDPRDHGVALATAFLIAGSGSVIATTMPLPAVEAPVIAAALYADTGGSPAFVPAAAYRAAMLGPLREGVSAATWQSLRLWVP